MYSKNIECTTHSFHLFAVSHFNAGTKTERHALGFFRILHLLSEFPWSAAPLIVDMDREFSEDDTRSIENWYKEQRASNVEFYSMAVCTPFDRSSSWTVQHPQRAILSRLRHAARSSLLQCASPLSRIFVTGDMNEFDVVLYLRKDALAHPERGLDVKTRTMQCMAQKKHKHVNAVVSLIPVEIVKKFSPQQIRGQLLSGFDPTRMLWEELTAEFGNVAVFCCDQQGGNVIGVHWKPQMHQVLPEPKVASVLYWKKVQSGYTPDKSAILSQMCEIGEGIIEDMETTA